MGYALADMSWQGLFYLSKLIIMEHQKDFVTTVETLLEAGISLEGIYAFYKYRKHYCKSIFTIYLSYL